MRVFTDYEEYIADCYTPMKAVEVLSDVIYEKANNDWNIFSQMTRKHGEELLALNYAIKLCAKHLLTVRQKESDRMV